jgi:hypothetical protein
VVAELRLKMVPVHRLLALAVVVVVDHKMFSAHLDVCILTNLITAPVLTISVLVKQNIQQALAVAGVEAEVVLVHLVALEIPVMRVPQVRRLL